MNEVQRHRRLLEYLENHTYISTNDYVEMLDISLSTARRDITKLAEEGRLTKMRNGAEAIGHEDNVGNGNAHTTSHFIPVERDIDNYSAKIRIARAAATLCDENDSVIVSGSNTTFLMGEHLAGHNIQVITNFMPLAYQLIQANHPSLIILGGQYLPERHITISPDTESADDHSSRFVFFTGTGITKAGVYTSDILVYMAEKKLLEYGDRLIALMDSSKIGKHGGKLLACASQLDTLITDEAADKETLQALEEAGVTIILV
ncbi:transcriptional repressor UlaR [Vibrio ichthyoenteri ATCC 700023]|uniref:Transcriptional repressor UlaR n=1 Tax=Vibrio ichthyoenteri ATCC 700023 TaxID=870968 RepID=F9S0M4_9VIBR|nr:HTH-type transcriptional regulator UlaR [Vibrio ichthyoenteri]EGU43166.1 transcriptional repressor UlaR [Vibrio ichthyoenteri ATCC 700023]